VGLKLRLGEDLVSRVNQPPEHFICNSHAIIVKCLVEVFDAASQLRDDGIYTRLDLVVDVRVSG